MASHSPKILNSTAMPNTLTFVVTVYITLQSFYSSEKLPPQDQMTPNLHQCRITPGPLRECSNYKHCHPSNAIHQIGYAVGYKCHQVFSSWRPTICNIWWILLLVWEIMGYCYNEVYGRFIFDWGEFNFFPLALFRIHGITFMVF